jgi:nucleotide-binding universal stress UspA family protein
MMVTILVPTDFSRVAKLALDYALFIAPKLNAQIKLLHVYEAKTGSTPDELRLVVEKKMQSLSAGAAGNSDRKLIWGCCQGTGVTEILREAEKMNGCLIVMGSTGASDLKRMILGSTTEKVLTQAKVPVIAVPEKAEIKTINKIVLTTGVSAPEIQTLKKIGQFAATFSAEIIVVHVSKEGKNLSCDTTKKLIEQTGYKNISCEVLAGSDIAKEINRFLEKENASLLVIVRKDKPFMKNIIGSGIAKKMAFHSNTPLLVFQESLLGHSLSDIDPGEILG